MKKIWPILCFVLLILLGIGIPVAYRQGYQHQSEVDLAITALIQGQEDLEVLQALHSGHVDQATKRIESRVWDMILPIHDYQGLLRESYWRPEAVDNFLRGASLQFQNHPVVLTGIISQEEALRRADASSATNQGSDPGNAEFFKHVSSVAAEANHKTHVETREIVMKYLKE